MQTNFSQPIDRRDSGSLKWSAYPPDVLPLWIADMDFAVPPAVIDALIERARHGVFGYATPPNELRELIVSRLFQRYQWAILPEDIVFLPGVVSGFNLIARAFCRLPGALAIQAPVYPPILEVARNSGLSQHTMQLTQDADGRYEIDLGLFQETIRPDTQIFLLCNPHNPVGRAFTRSELEGLAQICLEKNVLICSDEIHSDLIFSGSSHTPIASLDPEVARQTVTLMAPSKTFNLPGLGCAYAIVTDAEMRKRICSADEGLLPMVNVMGHVAALAAYRDGDGWLSDLLVYLEGNRDFLMQTVQNKMPALHLGVPEATYLAWVDCRRAICANDPYHFFLEKARVALNDGKRFGPGGEGFVRLNFACPRSTLQEAMDRMASALETYPAAQVESESLDSHS